jgi:hypothetical protein
LDWNNSLLKTIKKINELWKWKISNFTIRWEDIFYDTYIMSKEELDILHNMWCWFLSIWTQVDKSIWDDYIINYLKNSNTLEYTLFKRISMTDWKKITNRYGEIIK